MCNQAVSLCDTSGAEILRLTLAGGVTIATTAEHPFFEESLGWIEARSLTPGHRLRTLDGTSIAVESLAETGQSQSVYNLRVADWHTDGVGDDEWGWAVWAHNADCLPTPRSAQHGAIDHHNAMNGQAALHQAGLAHPAMPAGVRPQMRPGPGGVLRPEVRTNQAPINPVNVDGPPLRAGVPTTGGRYNVRPDVQVLGTDGRVYVTEVTRLRPNGRIDTRYHNNRRLQLQGEFGAAFGGYHHVDIP